jgi:hypothetical protein
MRDRGLRSDRVREGEIIWSRTLTYARGDEVTNGVTRGVRKLAMLPPNQSCVRSRAKQYGSHP